MLRCDSYWLQELDNFGSGHWYLIFERQLKASDFFSDHTKQNQNSTQGMFLYLLSFTRVMFNIKLKMFISSLYEYQVCLCKYQRCGFVWK